MTRWVAKLWPQGVAGQVCAILILALILSQSLAVLVYALLAPNWDTTLRPRIIGAKIATVVRILESLPVDDRASAAAAASDKYAIYSVGTDSASQEMGSTDGVEEPLRRWIAAGIGRSTDEVRTTRPASDSGDAAAQIDISLRGGGVLTVHVGSSDGLRLSLILQLATLAVLFVSIGCLAIWVTQGIVVPVSHLANAAEQLDLQGTARPVPERGPVEVRRAAHAFNVMQNRLRSLLEERTRMLAAISHDLRTALTRLRLRLDAGPTTETRSKMAKDVATMEAMVASTLAFVRDQREPEELESVDLGSLLQTVCDTFTDTGADIAYAGGQGHAVVCRPHAMMRALSNLIDNAVKYGGSVAVSLRASAREQITIDIEDNGPGIPDAQKEKVFEPFYRLDPARGADTGGVGLGLAIARTIVADDGGQIRLLDRQPQGLVVRVILPSGTISSGSAASHTPQQAM